MRSAILRATILCVAAAVSIATASADTDCTVKDRHLERPPGKTVADFRKDNDECFARASTQDEYVKCMLDRGYKVVAGKPTVC
jgi:hypothetical protein